MELANVEKILEITKRIGPNGQLLNVIRECSEMQILLSELLQGGQVNRTVFAEAIADLYVMTNMLAQMYQIPGEELENIAGLKLDNTLKALDEFAKKVAEANAKAKAEAENPSTENIEVKKEETEKE